MARAYVVTIWGTNAASTAWVPGNGVRGSWWQIAGPTRSVDSVSIRQSPATVTASWLTDSGRAV